MLNIIEKQSIYQGGDGETREERETVLARVAITKYHRLHGLSNRNVLLTVLEAGKSKIKVSIWSVFDEDSHPGL